MTWESYPFVLTPEHRQLLEASRIPRAIAEARGYRSIAKNRDAAELGLGRAQQRPGLWIPRFLVDGRQEGGQLRADIPRLSTDGRPIKYESPSKQPIDLDLHPYARGYLGTPSLPLCITEGTRKADSCFANFDIAAIALAGVFGWRGRNQDDGLTSLGAWESVAFKDSSGEPRPLYVVFDSDIMAKEEVRYACWRLGRFIESRGGEARFVMIPPGEGGAKRGMDDAIEAGSSWRDFVSWSMSEPPGSAGHVVTEEPEEDYSDILEESGAELLDDVVSFLERYLVYRDEHQARANALWAMHAHCLESFPATPRLLFLAPSMQSGKTRGLELLEVLVPRPELLANVTGAYLFRTIALARPVLLLDESDSIFAARANGDPTAEDIRGIVNSGYRKGAKVGRVEGQGADRRPVKFSTFAAVALAAIGALPATIMDRGIVLRLRRRSMAEPIEPFELTDPPPEAELLRRRMAAWAARHAGRLSVRPSLPAGVEDRLAEVWRPLFAISSVAGGEWPDRVAKACQELRGARDAVAKESMGVALLGDIYAVRLRSKTRNIHTSALLSELTLDVESPWRDMGRGEPLGAVRLASELRAYDIASGDVRVGDTVKKGYAFSDFHDAWRRYLTGYEDTGASRARPSSSSSRGNKGNKGNTAGSAPSSPVAPVAPVAPNCGAEEARAQNDPHGVGRDESGEVEL
jgi:hypothetical protein